ncbi:uncharacterized protein K444DRAFT_611815 [Hyaloscypha bicolor E]|jgi:hypothetical protein|uniref:Secreted protein n=1 Tax=Hyaloscypha bicolor E TaxID=1095630 RepID=A0A2J6TEV2_9HELO|nr:uncharacterized protein K444DRAFT_611815 [Hyaloscypha bicolor E]PMD61561.1 hypothetical protein K444DRAFT_611815 [Hyaloscypha bicolor E]
MLIILWFSFCFHSQQAFEEHVLRDRQQDAPLRWANCSVEHFALWAVEKLAIGWLRREHSEAAGVLRPRRFEELP